MTAATAYPVPRRCARCSATYSAVSMKRQNTIGLNPSSSSSVTTLASSLSLASPAPSSSAARAAKRLSRRRCGVSPSAVSPSAPGVASADSTVSSSGRSSTAERPSRSASATSSASRLAALVRRVAAAARGEEASARSSASADQYRTRCRSWPPSGSRTVSRAYGSTSSNSSLYAGRSAYVRSWLSRSSGNGVDSSR